MLSLCVVFRGDLSQAVFLSFIPASQLHGCATWGLSACRWPVCGGAGQHCCNTQNMHDVGVKAHTEPWFPSQHLLGVGRLGSWWSFFGTDVYYHPSWETHMALFYFPLLVTSGVSKFPAVQQPINRTNILTSGKWERLGLICLKGV